MIKTNHVGHLIAAHPKYPSQVMRGAVLLVLEHNQEGAVALQTNRPYQSGLNFSSVMFSAGLPCPFDEPLYIGGPQNQNRVYVVHSLDWTSASTTELGNNIGITTDLSILAALSQNQGPEYFRAIAGYTEWSAGELEGEISGQSPWQAVHSWNWVSASIENVFEVEAESQWDQVIYQAGRAQISSWF